MTGPSPIRRLVDNTEEVRRKPQGLALVAAPAGHSKLATTAISVQPIKQDLEAAVDSLMED